MSHRTRFSLRLIPTLVVLLSLVLQPVSLAAPAPVRPAAPATARTAEVASSPEARANAARLLLAAPNTVEITAAGIQPDVIEVTVNTPVTFINKDTVKRSVVLTTGEAPSNPGHKIFLPLILRSGAQAAGSAAETTAAQAAAPAAQETIALNSGASVQRTFTTPGNVTVTDAANPAVKATILVTPQPLAPEGNVTGVVLSFSTKLPIAGARVRAVDTSFEATADSQGRYTLPLPPGDYTLALFANGFTFANRQITVQPFTPLTVETVELVPLETVVTPIGAAGGTAVNAAGTTNVVFASGAVTTTKAVRLTVLPVDETTGDYDALPGPFRDGEVPIGFVMFEPDGTTFEGDAVWTIDYDGPLPVGYNWDDGLYCYYWLEKEARWGEPVPAEVVDLGGGKKGLRATLPHFSAYGFAAPPPPKKGPPPNQDNGDPADPDGPDNNPCSSQDGKPVGSSINFSSCELSQHVGTLGLPSLGGLPTQVMAQYRSSLMNNRIEISTTLGVSPGYLPPDRSDWTFTGAGFKASGDGQNVYATFDPTPTTAPGVHQGELEAKYWFGEYLCGIFTCNWQWSVFRTNMPWPVRVTRNDLSPFGLGWFSGHDTLLVDRGQWVTIVEESGSQVNFTLEGTRYRPPRGDFSTLTHNADGTWTRAYRNGSSLKYNADGRLERISDRYGNFQLLLYESNGKTVPTGGWALTTRLKRITDTSGNTFDYTYDANGWLAQIQDSAGRVYRLEHDAAGRLTAFVDPLGGREAFTYDARGMMTRHTDRRGDATSYVLDDKGRLLSRTWPTGSALTLQYSDRQTTVHADNGTQMVTRLDKMYNPVTRFNGVYTTTTGYNDQLQPSSTSNPPAAAFYDSYGNVIEALTATSLLYERKGPFDQISRATSSDGSDTAYTYDAAGNLTGFTDVLGQTYQMTYDSHGQLLSVTDPLGRATAMTYDARGQLTSVTDALGRTTGLAYDAAGRLTRVTNPLGKAATMEYDALNRLAATVDALNGRTTMQYDAESNLTRITDPTGRAINYTYDALNRLTRTTYADGGQEAYAYDPLGNVTGFTDANGKATTWNYDAANRPVKKTVAGGPTVTYAYDNLDQLLTANDGTLTTTTAYTSDTVGYPLRERQIAAGLPLSVTVDYEYGGAAAGPSGTMLAAAAWDRAPAAALPEQKPLPPVSAPLTTTLQPVPAPEGAKAPAAKPQVPEPLLPAPTSAPTLAAPLPAPTPEPTQAPQPPLPAAPADAGPYTEQRMADGPAGPATDVSGTITTNTTWTLAGSPYVVTGDVTVVDGVTLTIEAGVTVVMNAYAHLYANGVLRAVGTAGAPIVFTSATPGATGEWDYVKVGGGSVSDSDASQLSYVTLEGGGRVGQPALYIDESAPAVDHLTVRRSGGSGIQIYGSANVQPLALNTVTVENSAGDGIVVYDYGTGGVTLSNLNVSGSGGYGLNSNAASLVVNTGTVTGNAVAASLHANTLLTGVSFTGNTRNEIEWAGGTITADRTWPAFAGAYRLVGSVTVNDGVTLTIEPGVTVIMNPYTNLYINGALDAQGTALAPISFTSATPGATGEWGYVSIGGGDVNYAERSYLRYVTIEGAGYLGQSALSISDSAPALDHLTVRRSGGDGVTVAIFDIGPYGKGNLSITACSLTELAGDGIKNVYSSAFTVTATGCYWGSASGPYHPYLNPAGQGVPVSNGVEFRPWNPAYLLPGDGRLSGVRVVSNGNPAQAQHFSYDRIGQLTSLASTGYTTYTLAYTYDAAGQLLSRAPSAGAGLTYGLTYDAAGQPTRLEISGAKGLLLREDYAYDAAGNVTSVTSAQGGNFSYGYDASNRLTSATGPSLNMGYGYDAAGNRTSAGGVTFTYDAGGRLTGSSDGASYTYDAAGNLRTRTRGGATDTFTWDGQGRLTRIDYANGTYSAYRYDDAGRRISKRKPDGATIYYVYAGDMLVQELNASGAVLASYTYDGLDRPVTMWRGGQTYTYLTDRLGSVRGLADAGGNLVASYRYDPWGNQLASTGSIANPLRFTSREYDEESGLYFYRARYYDPMVGRFISRDPAHLAGDRNPYAYVRNNPVTFVDHDGEVVFLAPLVGAAVAAAERAAVGAVRGAVKEVIKESINGALSGGTSAEKLLNAAAAGAVKGAVEGLIGERLGRTAQKAAGAFAKELYNQYQGGCYDFGKLAAKTAEGALKGYLGDRNPDPRDRIADRAVRDGEAALKQALKSGYDKLMQGARSAILSGRLKYGPMNP